MNEILELQTGQVPFISGLMAGFSLSIAVQIFRHKDQNRIAIFSFISFTLTSLLFLIALYIDVALRIQIAGIEEISQAMIDRIGFIRSIGTSAATSAFFLFIISIGTIGCLQSKLSGWVTAIVAFITFVTIWISRSMIIDLGLIT